jgi:hypothetical protein
MSKSNPRLENPCKKFINWKGDKGLFVYYDKETEKELTMLLPVYFVWLDELATITGYCKKHDCGIYSNEVRKTTEEVLRIKTFKGGESLTGIYANIKDKMLALGGSFTKSVYAMLVGENIAPELVNFKFHGSAFSGWLEKKFDPGKCTTGIISYREETNGSINYKVPVFESFKLTPEIDQQAIAMDMELQEYLKEYKSLQPVPAIPEEPKIEPVETIEANGRIIHSSKQFLQSKSKAAESPEFNDLPWQKPQL